MRFIKKFNNQQQGQILILSLIILALTGIMVAPLLNMMNTGIKTTQLYQRNTRDVYAADAGIQRALWKIKYDPQMVSDRQNNVYGVSRPISTFSSNSNSVSVDITGNWIFYYLFNLNYGATPHNANLTAEPQVTPGTGTFRINFHNTGQPINIKEMGVWLPNGFSYAGSPSGITTRPPVQVPVYGGANLAWGQDHVLSYHLGTGDSAYQQFRYNPIGGDPREAACWVRPQESVGVSWDNDVVWYDVTSTAVDSFSSRTTTIEAIVASQSGASSSVTLVTYDINP